MKRTVAVFLVAAGIVAIIGVIATESWQAAVIAAAVLAIAVGLFGINLD